MEKTDDSWWWAKMALGFGVILFLYRLGVFSLLARHHHLFWLTLAELMSVGVVAGIAWEYNRRVTALDLRIASGADKPGSLLLGTDKESGNPVFIDEETRTRHTCIRGPTGYGKTSRGIERWAQHDIEQGRGFLIIDGKGDHKLLGQFYAKAKKHGREKDFLVFSLGNPAISNTFNPFYGGDGASITERVFTSFNFTDEYYKGLQYSSFKTIVDLFLDHGVPILPGVVRELLRDRDLLEVWVDKVKSPNIRRDIQLLLQTPKEKYAENHSGIVSQLGKFVQGGSGELFNVSKPILSYKIACHKVKIVYFLFPAMLEPVLSASTGKLVLQCLQNAIATIQNGRALAPERLFSVYMDDFNDFLYPEFVLLLNKSRSANIGVVFSHQSIGDIQKLGPEVAKIFQDSTCSKVFMLTKDWKPPVTMRTTSAPKNRRPPPKNGLPVPSERNLREMNRSDKCRNMSGILIFSSGSSESARRLWEFQAVIPMDIESS